MKKIFMGILSLTMLFVLSTVACASEPANHSQKLRQGTDGRIIIVESTNPADQHPLRTAYENYLKRDMNLRKSGYYSFH